MIRIYNPPNWPSAQALAKALTEQGKPAEVVTMGEADISWGFSNATSKFNPKIIGNKYTELRTIDHSGILTPYATLHKPPRDDPDEWLPRRFNHKSGKDLRLFDRYGTLRKPDYWVNKLQIVREFRIHVAFGKVLRAGLKVKGRPDAHPWIRTHKAGWVISYLHDCQEVITPAVREIAKKAVGALGYHFGGVDVGVLLGGNPLVFEVNSAPGLDNYKSAQAYARHFARKF
jgi:hypothetical protein